VGLSYCCCGCCFSYYLWLNSCLALLAAILRNVFIEWFVFVSWQSGFLENTCCALRTHLMNRHCEALELKSSIRHMCFSFSWCTGDAAAASGRPWWVWHWRHTGGHASRSCVSPTRPWSWRSWPSRQIRIRSVGLHWFPVGWDRRTPDPGHRLAPCHVDRSRKRRETDSVEWRGHPTMSRWDKLACYR